MKCVTCRQGETKRGTATLTLEREGTTLVVRNVPADVCQFCGEEYVDAATTERLLAELQRLRAAGVELEIRDAANASFLAA